MADNILRIITNMLGANLCPFRAQWQDVALQI